MADVMNAWRFGVALLALTMGGAPAGAQTISTGEPGAMVVALKEMGYKPGAIESNDGNPMFRLPVHDFDTAVVFGGCTDGKACTYVLFVSSFTDLENPPASWTNEHNRQLDLGKAWVGENGRLSFSLPIPTGGEPMSRAELRFVLDQWSALIGTLAQSAINEKLLK